MLELLKLGFTGSSRIYIGNDNYEYIPTLMPKVKLTDNQKLKLLKLMTASYCNTDQKTDNFACEFYGIVNLILDRGNIPLELEYLAIEELHEQILNILTGEK